MGSETKLKRGISPGPWLYLVSPHCEPDERGVTQISFGRSVFDIDGVLYTNHMPPTGDDGFIFSPSGYCTEDDARLICAAPYQNAALIAADSLLHELAEFLRDQHDVLDGDYGEPRPNRAMQLSTELESVAAKVSAALRKANGPTPPIASQGSPSTDDDAGRD